MEGTVKILVKGTGQELHLWWWWWMWRLSLVTG